MTQQQRQPFVLLGLPRSRTRWLSVFLGCEHDLLVRCCSWPEFIKHLGVVPGSVETAGMLGWRLLKQQLPGCRIGLIRRPVPQVVQSLSRKNWPPDVQELMLRNEVLEVIGRLPGVPSWHYADLSLSQVGQEIWTFCHGSEGWDEDRFRELCYTNVQIDLAERQRHIFAHGFALQQFKKDVAAQSAKLGSLGCLMLS